MRISLFSMKNVHKLALLGILTAGAIVISILESFIPSIGIPGIKLGLANIVILVTLYELGIWEAALVNLLRVLVANLVRGNFLSMGFVMSITGALFSLGIMIFLKLVIKKFSIIGVSVVGALFHVFGQILVAMIYLGGPAIIYYLPFIAISSIVTGILVGIVAKLIINTKVISKQKEKYNF